MKENISYDKIVSLFKAKSRENDYVHLNYESLVSKDYEKNSHSVIIDMQWLKVNNNTIKLILWYDNEWGYATRLTDLIRKIHC